MPAAQKYYILNITLQLFMVCELQ